MRLERLYDRKKMLDLGGEISRSWGVREDEDLTMEERKIRRIVERAREESRRELGVC